MTAAFWYVGVWLVMLAPPFSSSAAAQPATGTVSGIVDVVGPDQQPFVVPGVTLTLTCQASPAPLVSVTDDSGAYRVTDVPTGTCTIIAEMQGFQSTTKAVTIEPWHDTDVPLRLGFNTLREDVTVTGKAAVIDTSSAPTDRLETRTLQSAPVANERFQDALPLIPGVVRGPDGLLNINGSRSNQTGLTLNNASGTDPVTGEFAIEVPVDAIQSVQVQQTAYAPEYGQSGGAVATVETQQGGDKWRVQLNNFMPRIRERGGKIVGLESFTPRLTVGGPLVKGTLNVLGSVQYGLTRTPVESLPPLERDTEQEGVDLFTRMDWKARNNHQVSGSAVFSPHAQRYAGLNTFNPQAVTPSIDTDGLLVTLGDQMVPRANGVFDVRLSVKQFDVNVHPSVAGANLMLAPDVNTGSFFNSQDRTSRRVEWLNTYTLTPAMAPSHLFKFGAGASFESFDGTSVSQPVDIVDTDGTLLRDITFVGDGRFGRDRVAISAYVQDTWTPGPRVTLQYGVRADRDSATGQTSAAPRASFTLLATGDGKTLVRGGIGIFRSAAPLNVLSFDQLQSRIVRDYGDDAVAEMLVENRLNPDLHMGRSVNWDVQLDRELRSNLYVRVGYRQREGRSEPILHTEAGDNAVPGDNAASAIELRTDGQSSYREGQVTARYRFSDASGGSDAGPGSSRDAQIVASYTRSLSEGDLNSFNNYFGNIYNPVVPANEEGPMPWNAPNRFLIWGSFNLPRGFAVFPVLDVRNGFPLSTTNAVRDFVGPRN